MKVTVIAFSTADAHKANEGLAKLRKGVDEFKRDLKDSRVDLETLESFVKGLRSAAKYFEGFIEDERVEIAPVVLESGIEPESANQKSF